MSMHMIELLYALKRRVQELEAELEALKAVLRNQPNADKTPRSALLSGKRR